MIQVLTYSRNNKEFQGKEVSVNTLHSPESLDSFDINVIFLNDPDLWKNKNDSRSSIKTTNDLVSIAQMIDNSNKAQNVIIFPQNEKFKYQNWGSDQDEKFHKSCELKDMLEEMTKYILKELYKPIKDIKLLYENTKTKIGEKEMSAAFYFSVNVGENKTFSIGSSKVTTVKNGKVILSTLNIKTYSELIAFLEKLNLIQKDQECPEWMEEIKMFDDNRQWKVIEENNQIINQANTNITNAMNVINKNKRYKSILYTNGDELVETVFEILQEMVGCNLSQFVDEKGPDFVFEIGEKVFVGEIKGVNHNVNNENVSQLEYHQQCYLDKHEDVTAEDIVALLIMNHQRKKSILDREPVKETQIALAKKYGILIIDTMTLLRLFEKYLNNEKTREECLDILKNNIGLLTM